MANRQYIGARYVPKLATPLQWNENMAYEALTIVTDGNGNSFTSRKPVPAGIALTNAEYWANTGNFNAQLAELDDSLTTILSDIATIEQEIEDIGSSITPVGMKKIIFITDSYGVVPNTKFYELLRQRFGLASGDVFVSAVGGAGFVEAVNSFDVNLTTLLSSMSSANKNSVTHVFVVAGANDMVYGNKTAVQIINGISNFMNVVYSDLPNTCQVHIFPVGISMASARLPNFANGVAAYANSMKFNRCYFHNGTQFALKDKNLLAEDLLHPTNEGAVRISDAVYQAFMNGSCCCDIPAFTINGYSPKNDAISVDCCFNNGMWKIVHNGVSAIRPDETDSLWSFTTGVGNPVAELPSDYFVGTAECETIGFIIYTTSGVSGIGYMRCIIRLSGNKLYIIPLEYDTTNGSAKTFENVR